MVDLKEREIITLFSSFKYFLKLWCVILFLYEDSEYIFTEEINEKFKKAIVTIRIRNEMNLQVNLISYLQ